RGNDVLARYGGEEFAALLAQTDGAAAVEVAERIRSSIAARRFELADGEPFQVTISIGIATFDPNADPQFQGMEGGYLIGQTDKALYAAKADGRDRVVSSGLVKLGEMWAAEG
ncbi:MAG: diguanylate cyclase, partial [Gammaproteobacteria bacterium]